MKTAIIVDSTAGLSTETTNLPGIFQIYLSTIFKNGTIFIDTADEKLTQNFYDQMAIEVNYQNHRNQSHNKFLIYSIN